MKNWNGTGTDKLEPELVSISVEAQSALKPGPTVVRTRKPKFLNRDGYEKPKWVREVGVLSRCLN